MNNKQLNIFNLSRYCSEELGAGLVLLGVHGVHSVFPPGFQTKCTFPFQFGFSVLSN